MNGIGAVDKHDCTLREKIREPHFVLHPPGTPSRTNAWRDVEQEFPKVFATLFPGGQRMQPLEATPCL